MTVGMERAELQSQFLYVMPPSPYRGDADYPTGPWTECRRRHLCMFQRYGQYKIGVIMLRSEAKVRKLFEMRYATVMISSSQRTQTLSARGLCSPMRLSKGRRYDQWKHQRRICINLTFSFGRVSRCCSRRPTLTLSAPTRILPQETASSGLAPESDPSYCFISQVY